MAETGDGQAAVSTLDPRTVQSLGTLPAQSTVEGVAVSRRQVAAPDKPPCREKGRVQR